MGKKAAEAREPTQDNGKSTQDVTTEKPPSQGSSCEEEVKYPASWKLALVTIALCLAVFCMALVRMRRVFRPQSHWHQYVFLAHQLITKDKGQHNHCHSDSKNHRSVSSSRRRGLVRRCILAHHLCNAAHLRKTVHFLLHQMDLYLRAISFRAGFVCLRHYAHLPWSDLWTGSCWYRWRGYLLRCHPDCGPYGSFASTAGLFGPHWRNVWYRVGGGTSVSEIDSLLFIPLAETR
jgi:hypothetical protein